MPSAATVVLPRVVHAPSRRDQIEQRLLLVGFSSGAQFLVSFSRLSVPKLFLLFFLLLFSIFSKRYFNKNYKQTMWV